MATSRLANPLKQLQVNVSFHDNLRRKYNSYVTRVVRKSTG